MLLDPKLPKVEPIPGEFGRYLVESSRKGEPPYLVDLAARWPMGRCVCRNYECERWPAFKKSLYAIPCKHITAALIVHALLDIQSRVPHLRGDGE